MQTVLGKYEIRAKIASSAMSTVYEGWDAAIERRVAVKVINLEQVVQTGEEHHLTRFRREAQAAGRLQHPSIVAIYDYGETAESAYIVMEFVDGETLKTKLEGDTRYDMATISKIMEDLLAGLSYSHGRGVIHRDIKPANIMVTPDGRAKIADFGIARIDYSDMTQIGTVMGTPAYMSPEQFRGEPIGLGTDIYSAGVVLYQLLTGERPFEGGLATIMHKTLTTEVPKPSAFSKTVPTAADDVVARAMAKRPEHRYKSAAEFSFEVRRALATPRTSLEAPGTASQTIRDRLVQLSRDLPGVSASRAVRIAAGGLVLMVGGGAAAFWTSGHFTKPSREAAIVVTPPPRSAPVQADAIPASPEYRKASSVANSEIPLSVTPTPSEHDASPATPDVLHEPSPTLLGSMTPAAIPIPLATPPVMLLPPASGIAVGPPPSLDLPAPPQAPRANVRNAAPRLAAAGSQAPVNKPLPSHLTLTLNNLRQSRVEVGQPDPASPDQKPLAAVTPPPARTFGTFVTMNGQRVFVPTPPEPERTDPGKATVASGQPAPPAAPAPKAPTPAPPAAPVRNFGVFKTVNGQRVFIPAEDAPAP